MFRFYDIEVFPNDWMVVIVDDVGVRRIHNNRGQLKAALSSTDILVGYNNYHYDDIILWAILTEQTNQQIYETSKQIITNQWKRKINPGYLTLDVMQEARLGLSLKEAQANLGLNIHETPVDFDQEKLSPEEIQSIMDYCENDVRVTRTLFEKRDSYFTSKFELVQTFKLPLTEVKKTQAALSAAVLKARKMVRPKRDRLNVSFDERLKLTELPQEILSFYQDIIKKYRNGQDHEELEKMSFDFELAGVPHNYGFGGLHGARENYVHEGPMLQIDVGSFYPSLMINNGFVSRAAASPQLFENVYDTRMALKAKDDPKQAVYKIILNSTFGASKSQWNPLFDPLQANNICINGQLILTHLVLLLEPFSELIQSNTDGIVIAYENEGMRQMIDEVIRRFGAQYELKFDVDEVKKIAQRDVNNYAIEYGNGKVKAKGRMSNFEGGSWERNTLSIADSALVAYYMQGVPIQKTVIDTWKRKELLPFQLVAKKGKFQSMAAEVNGVMVEQQKVNRIFATGDKQCGGVYKVRDGKYHKVPNSSERSLVWNDSIDKLDKRKIDLNWYVKLIQGMVF